MYGIGSYNSVQYVAPIYKYIILYFSLESYMFSRMSFQILVERSQIMVGCLEGKPKLRFLS